MLLDSGLLNDLEQHAFVDGQPMCLYGDPAYPLRVHLQAPYRRENQTPEMAAFNKSMSTARVSVEWIFGDICNYFKFIDFKKNLKIGLSSVGKMYMVSALSGMHLPVYRETLPLIFSIGPSYFRELLLIVIFN